MTLIPAYGRDYKSKKQVEEDFNADKDFIISDVSHPYNGKYVKKSQLIGKYPSVFIRYRKLTKICAVKVTNKDAKIQLE